MKKILLLVLCVSYFNLNAQDANKKDSVINPKKGWTFGGVPAIAFDSDVGFKYGGLINLFYYGDGKSYPKYHHSIYLEVSRTTKGSGINDILSLLNG